MAYQESDKEITPLKLEKILSKRPEFRYDLSRITPGQKMGMLNNMCNLMTTYGLPVERCEDLMFFLRAVPTDQQLAQTIKLSSKIYELAKKQNTTFKDIVKGVVAKAKTVFYFPEEFPNSAYLLHAVYTHGIGEANSAGEMYSRGLKTVENLVTSGTVLSEQPGESAIKAPLGEHNVVFDNPMQYTKQ
jgi:hypothetical protein